jgi:hypothetical protein
MRLRAIKIARLIINSNPFSGNYSLEKIEKAKYNRELNRNWFIRNYSKLEKKLTRQAFDELKNDLEL